MPPKSERQQEKTPSPKSLIPKVLRLDRSAAIEELTEAVVEHRQTVDALITSIAQQSAASDKEAADQNQHKSQENLTRMQKDLSTLKGKVLDITKEVETREENSRNRGERLERVEKRMQGLEQVMEAQRTLMSQQAVQLVFEARFLSWGRTVLYGETKHMLEFRGSPEPEAGWFMLVAEDFREHGGQDLATNKDLERMWFTVDKKRRKVISFKATLWMWLCLIFKLIFARGLYLAGLLSVFLTIIGYYK